MKIHPENQPIFRVLCVLRIPLAVLAVLALAITVLYAAHLRVPSVTPVLTEAAADHPAVKIDVNSADADTLALLPGIGPALAERIIAKRDTDGPFSDPGELTAVRGIGEGKLSDILPYITCGAP